MLEVAAITYGAIASFVMASASRNNREHRRNPPILTLFGLVLMAFSLGMALLLLGAVAYRTFTVGA